MDDHGRRAATREGGTDEGISPAFSEWGRGFTNATKRITDWTLDEWEEIFRRRRREAVRSGILSSDKLLTEGQMSGWSGTYGLDVDDFEAVLVDVETIRRSDPTYAPPVQNGRVAERAVRWRLRAEKYREF